LIKARYTIQKMIRHLKKKMNIRGDLPTLIILEEYKTWIQTLESVLRHYDENAIRKTLLQMRMERSALPEYTHGNITLYDGVKAHHQRRWGMECLAWVLTPEPPHVRDWLKDQNLIW